MDNFNGSQEIEIISNILTESPNCNLLTYEDLWNRFLSYNYISEENFSMALDLVASWILIGNSADTIFMLLKAYNYFIN